MLQLAATQGISRELAVARRAAYRDVAYRLSLELTSAADELRGELYIRLTLEHPAAIVLDWRAGDSLKHNLEIISINGKAIDDCLFTFDHAGVPPHHTQAGENILHIRFASPIMTASSGVLRYEDKESNSNYVYSLFVPMDASLTFPCFDQPDLKARFTLEIKAPKRWTVISNSQVESFDASQTDDNLWTFAETKPISTYLFAFAAGEFEAFEDALSTVKTKLFIRRSQAARMHSEAPEILRLSRASLLFFEEYTERAFPFSKYDLVLLPEFPFRGMEHAGATFLREESLLFPSAPTPNDLFTRAELIAHENAHQWFGDLVTMRWFDDLWIKEGFATLMSYKALERILQVEQTGELVGKTWMYFMLRTKTLAYQTDSTSGTTALHQPLANLKDAKSNYGNIAYRKAPSLLRQIEFMLSSETFRRAICDFISRYEYDAVSWRELIKAFERASKTNLKDWVDDWILSRGMPLVEVALSVDESNHITSLVLHQQDTIDAGKTRLIRTRVMLAYESGARTFDVGWRDVKVELSEARGLARPLYVLPNYQDYAHGCFLLDDASLRFACQNISTVKNDFTRASLWLALWQDVRFRRLAPVRYIEAVISHAARERDDVTLQIVLAWAATAFNIFLISDEQAMLAPSFEKLVIEQTQNAVRPETRTIFFRALPGIASTKDAREFLKSLISDDVEPFSHYRSLDLSSGDKFQIIAALYALNDAEADALLDLQMQRDASDDANRYAFAARAARANIANKRHYFQRFLYDETLPESWIESALPNFNSPRQADLTFEFLDSALAALPALKETRKIFFINNWLAAFLNGQTSSNALRVVDDFLLRANLEKDLTLKVLEMSDTLRRAVQRKVTGDK